MRASDFDYVLPENLIAQKPLEPRDSSRLLVLPRESGDFVHTSFRALVDYLRSGDVLVLNDSRVIPARLYGFVEGREDSRVECLLLREVGQDIWESLVKPGKKMRVGAKIVIRDGNNLELNGEVLDITGEGERIIKFTVSSGTVRAAIHTLGRMPLPPYITRTLDDPERYQTVYAKEEGSAAAPTAGLHFTSELISIIEAMGIDIVKVTLHVGLGTFRPVKTDNLDEHKMHSEYYIITPEAAKTVNEAKGRVICVGTTSVRVLESASDEDGIIASGSNWTDIFIYPGYRFKVVDGLVTNFHLPKSTLLMLISALAGRERVLSAYEEAVALEYRFFSFGDAMLII